MLWLKVLWFIIGFNAGVILLSFLTAKKELKRTVRVSDIPVEDAKFFRTGMEVIFVDSENNILRIKETQ